MNEQVVTYLRKKAPLSDMHVHLMTIDSLLLSHSNSAFIDVRPRVGRISTMKRSSVNVFTIIERFSADRVQWSSARAVYATSTGSRAASKRSTRDGRNSTM